MPVTAKNFNVFNSDLDKGEVVYDVATKPIEKIREILDIVDGLHKHNISNAKISQWLKVPKRDVDLTLANLKDKSAHASANSAWSNLNVFTPQNILDMNVKWFLIHQHPVTMPNVNVIENYILELLSSNLSATEIAKNTIVKQPVISYLRNGQRQISKLSFPSITSLVDYYKNIKSWISFKQLKWSFFNDNGMRNTVSLIEPVYDVLHSDLKYNPLKDVHVPLKAMKPLAHGNWLVLIKAYKPSADKEIPVVVAINKDKKNKCFIYNKYYLTSSFLDDLHAYIHLDPSQRFESDEAYMLNDLKHKPQAKKILR